MRDAIDAGKAKNEARIANPIIGADNTANVLLSHIYKCATPAGGEVIRKKGFQQLL